MLAILDYIADDNPEAAQRLKEDLEAKVAKLPDFPQIYQSGRVQGTREMRVQANYLVIYSQDPITIRILRVLHASQQWPQV